MTNKDITKIRKVAIIVSANLPEVSYSVITSGTTFEVVNDLFIGSLLTSPLTHVVIFSMGPLLFFPAAGVEAAIRSSADREDAAKIADHISLSQIEDKVAQSFLQPVKQKGCFQFADYVKEKNRDIRQLLAIGYDAVISLSLYKIKLERVSGDNVRLYVHLRGKMERLNSGQIEWEREEILPSPQVHSLDYYKENGLKEIDILLERAALNLSYDFVYLK